MRAYITGGVVLAGLLAGGAAVLAVDGVVIVPTADQPFEAGVKDIVRIVAPGPVGVTVRHKLTGPAKLVTFSVRPAAGHAPPAGSGMVEYAIVPTGKGKVTFELDVLAPQAKPPAKVIRYEFEVR